MAHMHKLWLRVFTRDINGNWDFIDRRIGEIPADADDDTEIMMVFANDVCIYNALRDAPITWDDLRGFWS